MFLFLLVLILFAGVVNFYFSIQILRVVSAADTKISFFELRWQVHKNMRSYCQVTRSENGRAGGAYYGYWTSLLVVLLGLMLLFAQAFS